MGTELLRPAAPEQRSTCGRSDAVHRWVAWRYLGAACALAAFLSACSEPGSQPGGQADPVRMAARIAAVQGAALSGDQEQLERSFEAAHKDLMRSMKVPDSTRKIDRESARAVLRELPSVRSAAWIDHENLLVIVASNGDRSLGTIDEICSRLRPLGDTLAVVVNLQSAAATRPEDLDILSRNCDLPPGERAFAQRSRQVGVVAPEVRVALQMFAASTMSASAQSDSAEAQHRADEAMKVLEANTPELARFPDRR